MPRRVIERAKDEMIRNPISSIGATIACIVSLASPLTILWIGGQWTARVDSRLAHIEEDNSEHHSDAGLHMPYEQKVKSFVLRQEWQDWRLESDRQREEIRGSIRRIEDRTEKIYELLRK